VQSVFVIIKYEKSSLLQATGTFRAIRVSVSKKWTCFLRLTHETYMESMLIKVRNIRPSLPHSPTPIATPAPMRYGKLPAVARTTLPSGPSGTFALSRKLNTKLLLDVLRSLNRSSAVGWSTSWCERSSPHVALQLDVKKDCGGDVSGAASASGR
jgi:hypothetical protein